MKNGLIETFAVDQKSLLTGLLEDSALNWLALDGLWFQAVEEKFGIEPAMECGQKAIAQYSEIEAKRIMKRLGLPRSGGILALMTALRFRMYHLINKQTIVEVTDRRCVFRMLTCRVQEARHKKGLPDYPCKSVGMKEYSHFAKTVDPRIKTRCIGCPPDITSDNYACSWEFILDEF